MADTLTPLKNAALIKLWADGHEIEEQDPDGVWIPFNGSWDPRKNYRVAVRTLQCRVALLRNAINGTYFTRTVDDDGGAMAAVASSSFVKWITDWISIELPPTFKP